ncbi:hypothetical protein DSO57_1019906 [Entomophthora muscae]|uniref:Uncharacterized protein n=1 Tax=Entomophthora muscae TaxID=34485 RepID=A0ACC2UDG4_9FUNG|nr:hypothetical protein DSO57_1019906 [Entomophthora muscae]
MLWIMVKWGRQLLSGFLQFLISIWSLDWPAYLFCTSIPAPPAELTCSLSQALGGPDFFFPGSLEASCCCITDALHQLTGPASCWLVDTLSKHPVLFDNILPMAATLDVSKQPLIPWLSYLSFFCLHQGQQALDNFLTLFQAAAAKVSLPELAKLAALKVALNSTGANLPSWSEPITSLQELILRLQNFTLNHSEHASSLIAGDTSTLQLLPVQIEGYNLEMSILNPASKPNSSSQSINSKPNNSPLVQSGDKSTTKYELKWIQNSSASSTPLTFCVIDTMYLSSHARKTSPIDGNNFDCCTLPLNLFALNSLSLLTIEGHGESPSNFSDNSLFDYQYSPSSNCAHMVQVDCNDPVLPGSFSLSNILGTLSLSPMSRIEDPMTIFDANPPGLEASKSSTPSMIYSDIINKEFSRYFLLLLASPSSHFSLRCIL